MEKFRLIDLTWKNIHWEEGKYLPVSKEGERYLKKVLRLRAGDSLEVCDGSGRV